MNLREQVRQQHGEEALVEFDKSQRLKAAMADGIVELSNRLISEASVDGKTHNFALMGACEGAAQAYAGILLSVLDTLIDASVPIDRADFVAGATKSLTRHINEITETRAAQQAGVGAMILAAAKKVGSNEQL